MQIAVPPEGLPLVLVRFLQLTKQVYSSEIASGTLSPLSSHVSCSSRMSKAKEVRMRVRIGNRISSAFLAHAGVKQGDNLSPLLFGLFIDQIENFFSEKCGEEEGIRIADNLCRVILYAADLALLSASPSGLQTLLKHLEEFCRMRVFVTVQGVAK